MTGKEKKAFRIIHYRRRKHGKKGGASASRFAWFNGRKFFWNFIAFLLFTVLLQFAEMSKWGQEALDTGFDYLVRKNYEWAVLQNNDKEPVSPLFRFVLFDERTYRQSYTKGYWTPRDILGLTLLRTVQRGASVVLLDFSFREDAPVVLKDGVAVDGSAQFVDYLKETAELCRKTKTVVILPVLQGDPAKNGQLLRIFAQYPDVFRIASFKAERDSYDQHVRRFKWFEYSRDYAPILSANLMALLSLQKDPQKEYLFQTEAKAYLVGRTPDTALLQPQLAASLQQTSRKIGSRILFRILSRSVVSREYKEGSNALRGIVWNPAQIINEKAKNPDLTGKVVLIGSDFQENGDYHSTVFGDISGSYLLANTVNMVLTGNVAQENFFINLAVMLLIGFIFCFLYASFKPGIVNCTMIALSIFAPAICSIAFNKYGLFIDVWIPLVGIGVLNTIVSRLKVWNPLLKKQKFLMGTAIRKSL